METTGKQAWVSHKQAVPHCQSDVREPWSEPTHPLLPPPMSEAHCSQGNPLEDKSDHITPSLYIPWRPSSLRISSRLRSMAHESRAIQPHLLLPATPFTPSSPPPPSASGMCLAPSSLMAFGHAGASAGTAPPSAPCPADARSSSIVENGKHPGSFNRDRVM